MEENTNIREELADISGNPEMLFADGYDNALIGYTDSGVAVYCIEDIIMIMINEEEMTEEVSRAGRTSNQVRRKRRILNAKKMQ